MDYDDNSNDDSYNIITVIDKKQKVLDLLQARLQEYQNQNDEKRIDAPFEACLL